MDKPKTWRTFCVDCKRLNMLTFECKHKDHTERKITPSSFSCDDFKHHKQTPLGMFNRRTGNVV